MTDQEKKIAALYEAFGIHNDRHMEPEECDRNPQPLLTPEAELEVLRRRQRLEDQIMRDMFRVLVDEEFLRHWHHENGGAHHGEIKRLAETAAYIAHFAAIECVDRGEEYEERSSIMEKHIKALGVEDD